MPIVREGALAQGPVLDVGDLTAAPLTTEVMDVKMMELLSLGVDYVRGGSSTITQIDIGCEVSYDKGATWFTVAINPDIGTPPNKGFQDGVLLRTVSASDKWVIPDLRVGSFPLLRLIVSVGAGSAAAGDTLSIDTYCENSAGG